MRTTFSKFGKIKTSVNRLCSLMSRGEFDWSLTPALVSTSPPGLKPAFTAFLCFSLTMSLVSLAGVSLAFLVSASVSSFAMANILIALPFVFMMVSYRDQSDSCCRGDVYSCICTHACPTFMVAGVWWLSCQSQRHAELALLVEMDQYLQIRTERKI